jgi:hypothetical protein
VILLYGKLLCRMVTFIMANSKWICFDCRSTYNREHRLCPTCGNQVQFIGQYFKPPKRGNDKEWQAIKILYDAGIRYDYGSGGLRSELLDGYLESTQPQTESELLTVIRTASWYYQAYSLKWMAGDRPRHPREAIAYLEQVEVRKQKMLEIVQSVAGKLGRDHPAVQVALSQIAKLQPNE